MRKMSLRDWKRILKYSIAIDMRACVFCLIIISLGCQPDSRPHKPVTIPVPVGVDQIITEQMAYATVGRTKLSDYGYFMGKLSDLNPSERVIPYDLNTPLFSDYAKKKRFMFLPEGKKIEYKDREVLSFPIGTVLIKNFYYSEDQLKAANNKILETRLLIHEEQGWKALPYIWNQAQTEAYLEITGGTIPIALNAKGLINYTIPDMNQCKSCHDTGGKMTPIGPSVRQLNRVASSRQQNQLKMLDSLGWIELPEHELPKLAVWNEISTGSLSERARGYLDINCAHCHNDKGPAKNSGLNLTVFESDNYRLGVNKKPVAAGRGSGNLKYGIVPGNPTESIIVHRMQTIEPGTMMPELGRTIPHDEGLSLIREWINQM